MQLVLASLAICCRVLITFELFVRHNSKKKSSGIMELLSIIYLLVPGKSKQLLTGQAVYLLFFFVRETQSYNKTLHPAIEAETRLLNDLFKSYDKRVRPAQTATETIQASFGLSFRSLLDLNEKEEAMESLSYMMTAWHDGRLTWNKSEYAGIDSIRMPAEQIWKPDFVPYTTTDEQVHIMETMAFVTASGHVNWIPTIYLRSPCTVNLKAFPFDEQRCTIVFASYIYHGFHLNLTYWGARQKSALDISAFIKNANWELTGHSVNIERKKYQCCNETYPQIVIVLAFKRNPYFYLNAFVVPAILLGILAPISLLLPPESKERISLGSIIILAIVFMNTSLSEVLPKAHQDMPAISIYYTLILVWSVASLMCSVLLLNLHHRGPRKGKVPEIVRWIFLRSLRRLVCLGADSYYPLSDMEAISMRGLQPPANPGNQELRSNNTTSKMEKDMEDVSRQLNNLSTRFAKQEVRKDVLDEWHQLALVIDRTLFLIFLIIFIMCSVILLG